MTTVSSSSAIPEEAHVSVQSGGVDYRDPGAVERVVLAALEDLRLAEDFVRPGDRAVLKPNWVKEHDERFPGPDR